MGDVSGDLGRGQHVLHRADPPRFVGHSGHHAARFVLGHGDAAGAVLAVHLVQREGYGLALLHPVAFLGHQHVAAGLGQHGGGGGATRAGADDQHLGVHRRVGRAGDHAAPPVGVVAGHVSHT